MRVPPAVREQLRRTLHTLRSFGGEVGDLTLDAHCRSLMRVVLEDLEAGRLEREC